MSASAGQRGSPTAPAARTDPSLLELVERVRAARAARRPLRIVGGNTKDFYGRACDGAELSTKAHAGIVSYEPTELVITAKAGTLLADVEAALADHDQVLGFEPPRFGPGSTIGGVIAAGLSGPSRPWLGSARDFVLGIDLINGRGEALRFGGRVLKNVAGFDVSRLLTASLGTLGVITGVSLRVLPRPATDVTLQWSESREQAHARMLALAREPWPVSAMAFDGALRRVRLWGSVEAVQDAVKRLAPDAQREHDPFWQQLRDLSAPFFAPGQGAVWRLALPPAAPDPIPDSVSTVRPAWLDWGGAQRWFTGTADLGALQRHCADNGGHASCFRGREVIGGGEVFAPPAPAMRRLHARVKMAFDPDGIFNPGRLYGWM